MQLSPIEVKRTSGPFIQDRGEVFVNDRLLIDMVGNPPMVMLQAMDMILAPMGINTHVKEFCVGIPLFDVGNARTLLFPIDFKKATLYFSFESNFVKLDQDFFS
jgi:hypothetical protein